MSAPEPPAATDESGAPSAPDEGYSRYVLGVLVLVYVLNFLDRNIISILAEDIKHDLDISDADIGFLFGTAFAVFYAVFGIPLGRLADVWNRRSLISLGLAFWSLMTALSGLARSFLQLAGARVGVGVGEASATPAAFSMLSDSFPARQRATVLAIYSSGIYIGAGLGNAIGGQIVDRWNDAFATGGAPFGLAGWQAAYLAVGLPGILLAIWVRTLREPVRGAVDGIFSKPEPHPFREFFLELRAVLPGFSLYHLARVGASSRLIAQNGVAAVAVSIVAWGLIEVTGSVAQWIALGIGLYAAITWAQGLGLRDRPSAELIFKSPSLIFSCLGFSSLAFSAYAFAAFTPVFFRRIHEQSAADVGLITGATAAAAGLLGVTLGGYLADRMRARRTDGRLLLAFIAVIAPVPVGLWMLVTDSVTLAFVLNVPVTIFGSMWIGIGASTIQDLVLPRMRAVASAFYILVITFIGMALGPYTVGQLSDVLGDLSLALRLSLLANLVSAASLILAMRCLGRDEETLLDRARGAGEIIDT